MTEEQEQEGIVGGSVALVIWVGFIVAWWFTETAFLWMIGIGTIVALVVGALIISLETKNKEENEKIRRQAAFDAVKSSVDKYLKTLIEKRKDLTHVGDYGETYDDGWTREVELFLESTVSSDVYELISSDKAHAREELSKFVEQIVRDSSSNVASNQKSGDVTKEDAAEYKRHCAELLEAYGWDVTIELPGEDTNIDLIAKKSGRILALKCKKSGIPVKEHEIQDLYSHASENSVSEAVVVSNSPFTKPAVRLASKLSVLAMHHSQFGAL